MRLLMLSLCFICAGMLSAQITVGPQPVDGEPGKSYSHTFQATGGSGNYVYTIESPYSTPTGLVLNQNTGELSGTFQPPVIGDSYTFAVTATDSTNQQGSTLMTLSVRVKSSDDSTGPVGGSCSAKDTAGIWNLALVLAVLLAAMGSLRLIRLKSAR